MNTASWRLRRLAWVQAMSAGKKERKMAWFKRDKKSIDQATPPEERRVRTEGLWTSANPAAPSFSAKTSKRICTSAPSASFTSKWAPSSALKCSSTAAGPNTTQA